jgi:hypothetical protein
MSMMSGADTSSSSSSHSSDFYDSHGDPKCCALARPDKECTYTGYKDKYTCPSGYKAVWWTCCQGSQMVACGECAGGSTCYASPFYCSIWWDVGTPC